MPFLIEAVDSILRQTYSNFRLLIIDNGSTDGTMPYCKSLGDARIIFYRLEKPSLIDALNFGIKNCKAEYIARMDSDDISHPLRIEKQVTFLMNNKNIDIVGVSGRYIGETSKQSIPYFLPSEHRFIKELMINAKHSIVHGSILLRKDIIDDLFYDPEAYPCEDYELFLRLIDKYKFANLQDELYYFRIRKNSIQSSEIKESYKKYHGFAYKYKERKLLVKKKFFVKTFYLIKGNIEMNSLFFYRKGLLYYLNDEKIIGMFFFGVSSILSPERSLKRAIQIFKHYKVLNFNINRNHYTKYD